MNQKKDASGSAIVVVAVLYLGLVVLTIILLYFCVLHRYI